MQGAVGHEVIVADGGVVEDGQLDLMAVGHRGGELLVVRGLVGLLLGAGLPDAHLVHADRHVGVQQLVALTEQRVAEGPTGGLQPHRLADAHLQVAVELHGSGHGHPPGAPRSPEDNRSGVASRTRPASPRLVCSGGRAAAEQPPLGHTATPQPPRPTHRPPPAAAGGRSARRGALLGSARRGHLERGTAPGGEEPAARDGRAGPGWEGKFFTVRAVRRWNGLLREMWVSHRWRCPRPWMGPLGSLSWEGSQPTARVGSRWSVRSRPHKTVLRVYEVLHLRRETHAAHLKKCCLCYCRVYSYSPVFWD